MDDAERAFAERLVDEPVPVLGPGAHVDDLELRMDEDAAHAAVEVSLGDARWTIEAEGSDLLALYQPLVRAAAEARLGAALPD